jgi:hypothetical protein
VFDNNYVYELVNLSSGLALDVYGAHTAENTPIDQYTYQDHANQHFQIFQVASSQWKIIDLNSGKAITNRCGAAGSAQLNAYNGTATDNWAIDDHNGHFVIWNKASNAYLQAPSTAASATIQVTTNYNGTPDTDWDLYAVDSF